MALLSELVPDVLVYAPGAPEILVEQKLRDAAIEFCNKSGYWREDLDPVETEAGLSQYDIEPPADAVIKNILTLRVDDERPIRPTTTVELDRKRPGWRTQSNKPDRYVLVNLREFLLTPTPDKAYTITATATLRPSPDADELPDILADFQRETLVDGAIFKLLSMPKRQWTDPATAAFHRREFYRGVKQARIDASRQYSNAPVFVFPKPFA